MKNRFSTILSLFILLTLSVHGQSLIQLKQMQQGTADGQVIKRQGGVSVWSKLSYNDLDDLPVITPGLTSVGLSMPSGFSVSNSPLTANGTLTVTTTLNGNLRGNGTGFVVGNVNAATELSGVVGPGNGGTGLSTIGTNGQIIMSSGSALAWVTPTFLTQNQNITWTGTGDVTGTSTGNTVLNPALTIAANAVTTGKIATNAVTYPKMQNMTGSRLLGNPTGSTGVPSEISLNSTLSFTGAVLGVNTIGITGTQTTVSRTVLAGDISSGTVTIPLAQTPRSGTHILVFVNGVKADASAISTSSTNALITNASLPYNITAGDRVEVAFTY